MADTRQTCSPVIDPHRRKRKGQAAGGHPASLVNNPDPVNRATLGHPSGWQSWNGATMLRADSGGGRTWNPCPWLVGRTQGSLWGRWSAGLYIGISGVHAVTLATF